jgi:hypothetical protein
MLIIVPMFPENAKKTDRGLADVLPRYINSNGRRVKPPANNALASCFLPLISFGTIYLSFLMVAVMPALSSSCVGTPAQMSNGTQTGSPWEFVALRASNLKSAVRSVPFRHFFILQTPWNQRFTQPINLRFAFQNGVKTYK